MKFPENYSSAYLGKSTIRKLVQEFSDKISGISYGYLKFPRTTEEITNAILSA